MNADSASGAVGPIGRGAAEIGPGHGSEDLPDSVAHGSGARIRLVAMDLDGVVYRGGSVLPGACEALEDVIARGLDLRYVSNNSTAHREAVSERLAGMGMPAGADRVLTSGFVAARWLQARLPQGSPVMVMGEQGLLRELREAGLEAFHVSDGALAGPTASTSSAASPSSATPTDSAAASGLRQEVPAAVVVGMDRSLSFKSLARAQAAIRNGALFVATNPDPTFPTPDGLLPGAGSLVAAVATAAEQEPVMMGKPGLALAEILASTTGIPPAETLFVGDRLSTDIDMGYKAGMVTALVLTGVTRESDLEHAREEGAEVLPDHVLVDLRELPDLLDSLGL
jgi:phosphoglycolate/pyridoxal phosphate phosphatase family enzyme